MKHYLQIKLLLIMLLGTACVAVPSGNGELTQAPPRKIADSLRLPVDATLGPVIAGLAQGAIPQGMTLLALPTATLVTSHYAENGGSSRLVSTNWATGATNATYRLLEPEGEPHAGHVGGIAAGQHSLWIASDAYLYRGDLGQLQSQPAGGDFPMVERFATEATYEAAFCAVYGGHVWVGEFALGDKYPTDPSHHLIAPDGSARRGWISGYDPGKGFDHPQRVLSIPDRAQGMYATDEHIFLSISYGRRHRSQVEVHRNPLSAPAHRTVSTSAGKAVPLWFLDANTRIRSIDLPPMSQNIVLADDRLAVLFESGASKFRLFGKKPLDYIVLLPASANSR